MISDFQKCFYKVEYLKKYEVLWFVLLLFQLKMNEISLQNVLDGFNAPLSEEQAWAICHQCAAFLHEEYHKVEATKSNCRAFSGLDSLYLGKDGILVKIVPLEGKIVVCFMCHYSDNCVFILFHDSIAIKPCLMDKNT